MIFWPLFDVVVIERQDEMYRPNQVIEVAK